LCELAHQKMFISFLLTLTQKF